MRPFNFITKAFVVASLVAFASAGIAHAEDWQDVEPVDAAHTVLKEEAITAQDEVDRLTQVVASLSSELVTLQQELADAQQDLADKQQAVADAQAALTQAQADLAAAIIARDAALAAYNLLNAQHACSQNYATFGYASTSSCVAARNGYLAVYNTEVQNVTAGQADVTAKEQALDAAEADAEAAETAVETKQGEVNDLAADLAQAEADLLAAQIARDAAVEAFLTYNPVTHPGCKGVTNAQQQVTKSSNGKGKAVQTLAVVADKLGC